MDDCNLRGQIIGLGLAMVLACAGESPAQSPPNPRFHDHELSSEISTDAGAPPQRLLPVRTPASSIRKTSSSPPSALPLWGTVIGLGILACGLIVAMKWMRRHGPAVLRPLPNEAVEPLGQRVLSRGVAVHLVRCGGRMLLLGVGPDGVRTLSEMTDPVEVDLLTGACRRRDEQSVGLAGFSQMLQRTQRSSVGGRAARDGQSGYSVSEVSGV